MNASEPPPNHESPPNSHHDEYWKDAFDEFLPQLLRFLAPDIADAIDWDRGFAVENHELTPDALESSTGPRYPDRIYRVFMRSGESTVLFLHFEFEAGRKSDFPERVAIYRMRLFLKLRERIFTLALLLDGDPKYRPSEFRETVFDNSLSFRYRVVKLLDLAGSEEELLTSGDPARFLVAIKLIDLRVKDPEQRYAEKTRILRRQVEAMRRDPALRKLTRFLIHGIMLSRQRNRDFHVEVMKAEQEYSMPFVTIYEREAEARGEARGEIHGQLRAKREFIVNALRGRFGTIPLDLSERLEHIEDSTRLDRIFGQIFEATDLENFRLRVEPFLGDAS